MQEASGPTHDKPVDAVICIDGTVYARYHDVLRHLCVGLIDVISSVRLASSAPEAQSLTLGPVQTVLFRELRWPLQAQRFRQLADALAGRRPSVIHAFSAGSYRVAEKLAVEFDADLVCQVTAVNDIRALVRSRYGGPRHVICSSQPLLEQSEERSAADRAEMTLIRPGVVCAGKPTCFCEEEGEPAILSTADLTLGSGVETLLRAVHLLYQRQHRFLTFLLGSGRDELKLRRIARELGLGSSVVFAQPEGDLLLAMTGADIFVLPAVEQFVSARSLQALGQGMAVVGITGGVGDAYLPNKTAVLARAPTAADIAASIEELLVDHKMARTLAAGAIEHMRAHHAMSTMAELTAGVYRKMAVKRRTLPLTQ